MTRKIAVSLPDEQVEAARAAVAEGRAPSVSAYVSEALARRSAEDELLELLDEDETREPATQKHRSWARRALGADAPGSDAAPQWQGSTRSARSGRSRAHDSANQLGSGGRRKSRAAQATDAPKAAEPHRQTERRVATVRQSTSDKPTRG